MLVGRGPSSRGEKNSIFYSQSFVVEDDFRKDDVLGVGKRFFDVVPGRSARGHAFANPCGSLLKIN